MGPMEAGLQRAMACVPRAPAVPWGTSRTQCPEQVGCRHIPSRREGGSGGEIPQGQKEARVSWDNLPWAGQFSGGSSVLLYLSLTSPR